MPFFARHSGGAYAWTLWIVATLGTTAVLLAAHPSALFQQPSPSNPAAPAVPFGIPDEEIQKMSAERAQKFRDDAPMTGAAAAKVILDGVKAERWRILVGDDAHLLDQRVRANPENAYELDFFQRFAESSGWRLGTQQQNSRQ